MSMMQWLAQGGDYVLAVCGVMVVLGAALAYIGKWLSALKRHASRPHDELKEHVEGLAAQHRHYDACLKRDKERLDQIDADDKLVLKALMQLITHELDGNHVDKLAEVRDAIHDHLIER